MQTAIKYIVIGKGRRTEEKSPTISDLFVHHISLNISWFNKFIIYIRYDWPLFRHPMYLQNHNEYKRHKNIGYFSMKLTIWLNYHFRLKATDGRKKVKAYEKKKIK